MIEAEDCDYGGEGLSWHDTTSGGRGVYRDDGGVGLYADSFASNGCAVGSIAAGEWLEYSIAAGQATALSIALRVAATSGGKTCAVKIVRKVHFRDA